MARIAWPGPSTQRAAVPRFAVGLRALVPLLLVAGCASWQRSSPVLPEVTAAGVAARVLIPHDLNVNPTETVVKPRTPGSPSADPSVTPVLGVGSTTFTLPDAVAFGLRNNPRFRSAGAAVERARGQGQVAFAPFLPQLDLFGQYGVTSSNLGPGVPGSAGFLRAINDEPHSYQETELAPVDPVRLRADRRRYRQAVARGHRRLQLDRAAQAVEFDVANAYLDVLLARASRRVQEDAVRRAEAILGDTAARREGGVALKEDVLRADVQLSESREALVVARQGEFNAVARLNNTMGRNAPGRWR